MSDQNPTTDPNPDDLAAVVPLRPRDDRPAPSERSPRPERPARLWREALGDEIRRQRMRRKDRLKDTAERAGISPQYLSELERGMKDPSSEILEAVAGALRKSSFDLVRSTIAGTTAPAGPVSGPSPTNPVLLAA
ncbi:MAG TPA: helix-turn-helix transcriptional regulator [Candidatus Corynebacterium avicola]|uniref:Helix-turn-helix transcriptional regulator n=1 Tax=Candidatus Corynebacterium avicola TaxID=2838527 RepID=A0A9D1RR90_9CORY|nr:helix-turn-helix transcriptional regulator [Candidatus Corynebacterium avicola]